MITGSLTYNRAYATNAWVSKEVPFRILSIKSFHILRWSSKVVREWRIKTHFSD